jgi:hypothetical protein
VAFHLNALKSHIPLKTPGIGCLGSSREQSARQHCQSPLLLPYAIPHTAYRTTRNSSQMGDGMAVEVGSNNNGLNANWPG